MIKFNGKFWDKYKQLGWVPCTCSHIFNARLPVVGQFCGIVKLCQQSMMLHLSKPGLSSFKMNCVFISINWWKSMHMITHIIANIHSCSCFLVSTCNKEASRVWELKLQGDYHVMLVLHKAPLYTVFISSSHGQQLSYNIVTYPESSQNFLQVGNNDNRMRSRTKIHRDHRYSISEAGPKATKIQKRNMAEVSWSNLPHWL